MTAAQPTRRQGPLAPHPELWAWLEGGSKLRAILEDFYSVALVDPRLMPFFHGVTRERIVDKQYSFLAQIFSGENLYFGDRPRNAHHWMVISDELFDYREQLFTEALERAAVPEALKAHWLAVHQVFRKQIVKAVAFPRRMGGVDLPLDGWRTETLLAGTMCDGCGGVLDVGMTASSHRRTGKTLCVTCFEREEA